MSEEKLGELRIKVPARWVGFIEEMYAVSGKDRNKELLGWIRAAIECDVGELGATDYVRLVEKYHTEDICEIVQWHRDEVAGIQREVPQPAPVKEHVVSEAAIDTLASFATRVAWKLAQGMTLEELEKFKALTREELDDRLITPTPSTPEEFVKALA